MRFLFDNNFSPRLVNVLRLLDVDAIALGDEFSALFLKRFWVQRQVWEQAAWLTRHWRKPDEFARTAHHPFYAEVDRQGKISQFKI